MAMASIAAGADGVMLEVHPDPPNAAVDPLQAINYEEFQSLMRDIDKIANLSSKKIL